MVHATYVDTNPQKTISKRFTLIAQKVDLLVYQLLFIMTTHDFYDIFTLLENFFGKKCIQNVIELSYNSFFALVVPILFLFFHL